MSSPVGPHSVSIVLLTGTANGPSVLFSERPMPNDPKNDVRRQLNRFCWSAGDGAARLRLKLPFRFLATADASDTTSTTLLNRESGRMPFTGAFRLGPRGRPRARESEYVAPMLNVRVIC